MAASKQVKSDQANPMDVVEISVGTTPQSWDLAQMHPPGPQQPGMDPFAEEKRDPEDLDAGAMWPREPGGPKDPDNEVGPLAATVGTVGQQPAKPQTEAKTVSPSQPDSTDKSVKGTPARSANKR